MVSSKATTVEEYLAQLPLDKRKIITSVRQFILAHLPQGYVEGMQYGMISFYVPLSIKPDTYNGQPLAVVALAAQKNYFSLYLMGIYLQADNAKRFEAAYRKTGKKLDMGKSCLRFQSMDDLASEVIAEAIASVKMEDLISFHDYHHGSAAQKPALKKKSSNTKSVTSKSKTPSSKL